MRYVCPNCGRLYEERPTHGGCVDCDGMAVIDRYDSKESAAVSERVAAFHKASRWRNALVLGGLAVGAAVGVALTAISDQFNFLSPFVLSLLCAGAFWGIGTTIFERRHHLWATRSRASRTFVGMTGVLSTGVLVFVGLAVALSGTLGHWAKESSSRARRMWSDTVEAKTASLASCFSRDDAAANLTVRIAWLESGSAVVFDASAESKGASERCVLERIGTVEWPPMGPYRCVTCEFEAFVDKSGLPKIKQPDDGTTDPYRCVWTSNRNCR